MSTSTLARPAAPGRFARRCHFVYVLVSVLTIMTAGSLVMLLAGVVTLFRARRFYTEVLARAFARAVLAALGIKLVVHRDGPLPQTQTVYISNHPSSLDLFILVSLGLPKARFFLWGGLRKNPLLCVMGYLTGTFWTVSQDFPQRRAQIFQRAERILRGTGESVYASPEGMRVANGEIGHFNKGAFHLATALRAPLQPFYLAIPPESNPGLGYDARPGVVHVHFRPAIPTHDWKLEDLDANRRRVRDYFVQLHEELKPR
jgi:1-acyl-sn-glycerol-3-phosphate acyltransferase